MLSEIIRSKPLRAISSLAALSLTVGCVANNSPKSLTTIEDLIPEKCGHMTNAPIEKCITELLINLGVNERLNKNYDKSTGYFNQVLKRSKNHPVAIYNLNYIIPEELTNLAVNERLNKNYDKSIEYFNQVLKLDHENPVAIYNLNYLIPSEILRQQPKKKTILGLFKL